MHQSCQVYMQYLGVAKPTQPVPEPCLKAKLPVSAYSKKWNDTIRSTRKY